MSVRKIKKSYISCTGYFSSYKNKKQIAFESVLERDFYMLLEFDDNVVYYEEQPMSILYDFIDGKNRKYTPDALVTYKDGSKIYYEVKYIKEINSSDELREKLEYLKEYFHNKLSLKFNIFTDQYISKVYLENLKFLYKFAFLPVDINNYKRIDNILNSEREISIKEILIHISSKESEKLNFLPFIWKFVFDNLSVIDLNTKITMNTKIKKRITYGTS